MNYLESSEDYLEAILKLSKEKGTVRAIDIATELGFTKPSVSIALKKLKEKDLIQIENNLITLTNAGFEIATKILERHEILTKGLMLLGVSEEQAKIDACLIEHDLSDESFNAIKKHFLNK